MSKWITLLAMLVPMLCLAEPAWRWVDANGVVHYSDRPYPGAEQVELPTSSRSTGTTLRSAVRTTPGTPQPAVAAAADQAYSRFEILSPTPQETLWNTGSTIDVQVAVEPPLTTGHRLELVYDGARRRVPGAGTTLTLDEVFRGQHTLQALIVDTTGAILLRSAAVDFVVQQTSTQNPNNPNAPGNAPRPPPRPTPRPQNR